MNGSIDLTDITILEFDWDHGNKEKNYIKHKVTFEESEEIFYNQNLSIFQDLGHSKSEKRFTAYGNTDKGRKLTVVFTIRKRKLRIISARNQSKKKGGYMRKLKIIPKFKNEDEERNFWATHDTTEYFDTDHPVKLNLSNLKKSAKSITVRLPESLLYDLKMLANKKDVPYQSLLKVYLAEKVREEMYSNK